MGRLIDADALIEELNSLSVTVTGLRCGKGYLTEIVEHYKKSVMRIIDEQPTVATVEPLDRIDKLKEEIVKLSMRNFCDKEIQKIIDAI